jgi:cellulose synthase/poly-beta-1,6-N-acetylglucosamine synthase-like glycosyltransferase
MNLFVQLILLLLAVPAVLACAYLLALTLLSAAPLHQRRFARRLRFDVIVPAHNEAAVIERCVRSLLRIDWPAGQFRVLVVADNCDDATAVLARRAGAEVLERRDDRLRGKGYALDHAFRVSREHGLADAVVVVDADAEVSSNLLEAFAARIEQGAQAVQAYYGVLNPLASWRTRLLALAHGSFHGVRSRARELLHLSCGLRGNGWCVTHELLERVPYRAYSLTEDLEYGIDLGLAGWRVWYAGEARADAEMVSSENLARKQRQRWEHGRFRLIRDRTWTLLRAAVRRRSAVCLDLALDLLVLPISYVVLNVVALILCAALAAAWRPQLAAWFDLSLVCGAALSLYVLRGAQISGLGARGFFDLSVAPVFLLWKLATILRRREALGWVRTERERP